MKVPINKFTVLTVSPSHGHTDHQIISSLQNFKEMTAAIQASIERIERRLALDNQFSEKGALLFNDYVTLAPGRTEKNSISFILDTELVSYERLTLWGSYFREPLLLLVLLATLILASIGLITVIRYFAI